MGDGCEGGRAGLASSRESATEAGPGAIFAQRKEASMKTVLIAIALVGVVAGATIDADAQSWRPPTDAQRCPSKWGASDERGSTNHMKPESVLRATRLIKSGEVIELGWTLAGDIPLV